MTQVYLLLRNNEQSGPYSLDDLARLQLTEKDMVKVAGSNSGWFYPYELGLPFTLSRHLNRNTEVAAVSPPPPPKNTKTEEGSSIPDPVDQTIEELSKKITAIRNNLKLVEEQIHADIEEQKATGVEPNKTGKQEKKKEKKKTVSFTLLLLAVLFIAILTLSWILFTEFTKEEANAATPVLKGTTSSMEDTEEFFYPGGEPSITDTASMVADSANAVASPDIQLKKPVVKKRVTRPASSGRGPLAAVETSISDSGIHSADFSDERKVFLSYVMAEEERKTLLQKIAALFKKKEEPVNTNTNPITEETINDKLRINISTTNYKWLKGVQGLVLTMHNESSQTVKRATVNVVYYTSQNAVIERSTIHFSNILPRKSQAIAASDHQWAHHAGYEIVSVAVVKP